MPNMSMEMTTNRPKTPVKQRLSAKIKPALDDMVYDGLSYADAARKHNLTTRAMRLALSQPHVIGYINEQKHVFRSSLSTQALTRIAELSLQSDNLTAAVAATRTLLNESDQEHRHGPHQAAPGLVVQIINSPGASQARIVHERIIDIAAESDDTVRDD